MDSININIKNPIQGSREIKFSSVLLNTDGTISVFIENKEDLLGISKGETLIFRRYINGLTNTMDIINENCKIIDINDNVIILNQPEKELFQIYNVYSANTITGSVVELNKNHNVFLQDISKQKAYFFDFQGNIIGNEYSINNILKREDILITSANCITSVYTIDDCNENCNNKIEINEYVHTPESFSRTSFVVNSVPDGAFYVGFKYNPFYYIDEDNNCVFWEDSLWKDYENKTDNCKKFINVSEGKVVLVKDESYWNIGLGLSSDSNESKLGSEDNFNKSFVEDIIEENIPEFIDMERLKYSPVIMNGDDMMAATSITMNFHFRKRMEISDRKLNSSFTSGNVYYDSWNIDTDKETVTWWNGMDYDNHEFDTGIIKSFIESNGNSSDLVGYLNFTDNDIFYRKKKVSKSFVRLSFYTSRDPIGQKLLYFSTVFLDGGILYGKYLKQLLALNNGEIQSMSNNKNTKVVFTREGTSPVDTQIIITNEYDYTKSSEGFNLYLFGDDSRDAFKNSGRIIYMKVEFNHAGNGKTIPMIMWPVDGGNNPIPLNTDNFFENLYIPIEINYKDGKYIYSIPRAENNDGNINLVLFEPKLDILSDANTGVLKYSTTGSITKNLNGTLYIRPGVIIYDKLPKTEQEGHTFNGWYIGNEPLTSGMTMPELELEEELLVTGTYSVNQYNVIIYYINENNEKIIKFNKKYNYNTPISAVTSNDEVKNILNEMNTDTHISKLTYNGKDVNPEIVINKDIELEIIVVANKFPLYWDTTGVVRSGVLELEYNELIFNKLPKFEDITTYEFKGWNIIKETGKTPLKDTDTMPKNELVVTGEFAPIGYHVIIIDESKQIFEGVYDFDARLELALNDFYEMRHPEYSELTYLEALSANGYTGKVYSGDTEANPNYRIIEKMNYLEIKRIPNTYKVNWIIVRNEEVINGTIEIPFGTSVLPALKDLPIENMEGYEFTGWFLSSDYDNPLNESYLMPNKEITVIGNYKIKKYFVKLFDLDIYTQELSIVFNEEYNYGTKLYEVLRNEVIVNYLNNLTSSGYDYTIKDLADMYVESVNVNKEIKDNISLLINRIPKKYGLLYYEIFYTDEDRGELVENFRELKDKNGVSYSIIDYPVGKIITYPTIPNNGDGQPFKWIKSLSKSIELGFELPGDYFNGKPMPNSVVMVYGGYENNLFTVDIFDINDEQEYVSIYLGNPPKYKKGTVLSEALNEIVVNNYLLNLSGLGYTGIFMSGDTEVSKNSTIKIEENIELKIKRIPNTYNITFIDYTESTEKIISAYTIAKDEIIKYPYPDDYEIDGLDYTFVWDDESFNGEPMPNKDLIIKGKYSNENIVIRWSTDGLKTPKDGRIKVDKDSTEYIISILNTEISTGEKGHEFIGWYYKDGTKLNNTDRLKGESIDVVAKYKINKYTVRYSTTGGSTNLNGSGSIEYDSVVLDFLNTIDTKLKGYEFKGWYYEGEKIDKNFYMPDHSIDVTGEYEILKFILTFCFDIKGQSTKCKNEAIEYNTNVTDKIPTGNAVEVEGYTFLGWYYEDGTKLTGELIMPDYDLEFRGKYEINKHNLIIKTIGLETEEEKIISVPYNHNIYSYLVKEDKGDSYIFKGWFTADGKEISENAANGTVIVYMPNSDLTVYVKYEKVKTRDISIKYACELQTYSGNDVSLILYRSDIADGKTEEIGRVSKSNPETTFPLPDRDDYLIWGKIREGTNDIMPQYQYVFEASATTGSSYYRVFAYNSESPVSGNGYTYNELTNNSTLTAWTIHELLINDISNINVVNTKISEGKQIVVIDEYGTILETFTDDKEDVSNLKTINNIDIIYTSYNEDDSDNLEINEENQAKVWWTRNIRGKDVDVIRQYLNKKSIFNAHNLVNWIPEINKTYGATPNEKVVNIRLSDKN